MRPRVLFHCQHSLGLGHLVRSLALAGGLAERSDVTLLNGGRLPAGIVVPAGVELVDLPSLGHDDAHRLVSHEPGRTVEQVQEHRRRLVLDAFTRIRPDVVVVELYPFGRRKFEFELVPLLEAALAASPRPLVVSSVRDLLVGRQDQGRHDDRVALLADRFLDAVLVHSDPSFARLEESFRPATPLGVPVHHTGFVVPPERATGAGPPIGRVLVSAGGGMVGGGLLTTAAAAAGALHERTGLTTTLVAGPFLPDAERQALHRQRGAHVTVVDRVEDNRLCDEIRRSAASVSQCGYNTSLDLVRAARPAVVVPYEAPGEDEQARRAARLHQLGLVRAVAPWALSPDRLVDEIVRAIGDRRPRPQLDLRGRERSAELIDELLAAREPGTDGVWGRSPHGVA